MSYNGTVRCSYCYNKGHNRRSCPQLKKYIEENPSSYTAQTFKERKAAGKKRACSYCEKCGHNRKTCRDLKNDVDYYQTLCVEMRREVLEWLHKNGIGAGALVAYSRHGDDCDRIGLVKGCEWHQINPRRADHRLQTLEGDSIHSFLKAAQCLGVAAAATPNKAAPPAL